MVSKIVNIFKRAFPKFIENSVLSNVLLLAGGTAISQAVYVFVAPILSRLYTPTDFATLAVYISFLGILCGFSNLAYHIAIPISKEESSAKSLLILCILIQLFLTAFLIACLFFIDYDFFLRMGWESLYEFRWYIPVGFLGTGLYTAVSYYFLRLKRFKDLSRTKILQKIMGASISVLGGGFGFRPSSLIIGHVVSLSGGVISLFRRSISMNDFFYTKILSLHQVAYRYRKFPLYQSWGSVIDTLNGHLPTLLMVSYFSSTVVGWYAFSMQVLQLPLNFIGTAIGQVFFQRGSVAYHDGKLGELTERFSIVLILIATYPFLLFGVLAPDFFAFVFGDTWREAGMISRYLCFFLWAQFIASTISSVLFITEKLRLSVAIPAILLFSSLMVLYLFKNTTYYVFFEALSITKGIVYILYLFAVILAARASVTKIFKVLVREIIVASCLVAPIFFVLGKNVHIVFLFGIILTSFWLLYLKKRSKSILK